MSASTRKFLFERDFDLEILHGRAMPAPPPQPEPELEPEPEPEPPPPPEPTFSAAEVEAARAAGYAAGWDAGQQDAAAGIEQAAAEALAGIGRELAALNAAKAARDAASSEASLAVGVAIARKLLPETSKRNGLAEVEAMIGACLGELMEEPRVTIRVASALVEALKADLDALAAQGGFGGRLVLLADPALAPGDCRIEWADGGMERSQDRLWQDIDRALSRMMTAPEGPG